jgi:hypothetical protein
MFFQDIIDNRFIQRFLYTAGFCKENFCKFSELMLHKSILFNFDFFITFT